jgi:uncharacterized protein YaaQ
MLVVCVVQRHDADSVVSRLARAGYGATVLSSTGGFLRRGNATILTLAAAPAVDEVISLIRGAAAGRPPPTGQGAGAPGSEAQGGASVWVLRAELAGYVALKRGRASGAGED